MRRIALLSASLLLFVAVPAQASATAMPPATHHAISKLIDSFVKDVVLRRDLAAGWKLVGPDMRGGTTRAAWIRGTGVTVQQFPAVGDYFGNSWDGKLVSPREADLQVGLRSGGKNAQVMFEKTVVIKVHGRWIVNDYYGAGIVRTGSGHRGSCAHKSCAITGVNDFGAGSSATQLGLASADQSHWMWVGLGGVGGLLFGTLVGVVLYIRLRDRRAVRAFEAHMGRR